MFVDSNLLYVTLFYYIIKSYLFHRARWHEYTLVYIENNFIIKSLLFIKEKKKPIGDKIRSKQTCNL